MGCASSTPTKVGPNVAAAPEEPSQAPRRQGSSLQNRPVSQRGDDGYAAFISHVKAEASMEARFVQGELETAFGQRIFLDSDDLRTLSDLTTHVRESDVLVLVQSKSVLTRPYCIQELCAAIDNYVPILGVSLTSGAFAYDFGGASAFLECLDIELERRNPGALSLLEDEGIDVAEAAWKLSLTLPAIVSTPFNPSASKNMLEATRRDILLEMEKAAPLQLPSRERFLQRRARSASKQHGSSEHHARDDEVY